jgi:hypothetical protein
MFETQRKAHACFLRATVCFVAILLSGCGSKVPTNYLEDTSGRAVACTGIGTYYTFLEGWDSLNTRNLCTKACLEHGFHDTAEFIRRPDLDDHLNLAVQVIIHPVRETDSNRNGQIPALCGGRSE